MRQKPVCLQRHEAAGGKGEQRCGKGWTWCGVDPSKETSPESKISQSINCSVVRPTSVILQLSEGTQQSQ